MWTIGSSIKELLSVRYQLGQLHGSDEICILLYSLVKREQPRLIIELGTGLGVSTCWMAAALQEIGTGHIFTYDNGAHYKHHNVQEFLTTLRGSLDVFTGEAKPASYEDFLEKLFSITDVSDHVTSQILDFRTDGYPCPLGKEGTGAKEIDMIFADFNHSPTTMLEFLAYYLPKMAAHSSIFIDSASTHLTSLSVLEKAVALLNSGTFPRNSGVSSVDYTSLDEALRGRRFQLVHLLERADRNQNSTAWIRISPAELWPSNTLIRGVS